MRANADMLVVGVLVACWPSFVNADVFRCIEAGKTIYQGVPCKAQGQTVDMTHSRLPAGAADKANQTLEGLRTSAAAQERERRIADSAAEIEGLKRTIEEYERAEQAELAPLRTALSYINFNYVGAIWDRAWAEQAVRQQMQSVTQKYESKKQTARDRMVQIGTRDTSADTAPKPTLIRQ